MCIVFLLPFVCACACSDLKTGRIPNSLIVCGLAGAVLLRLYLCSQGMFVPWITPISGAASVLRFLSDGFLGFLLPWLCFGFLAALRMMGGGDVKMLSVIGLHLGARAILLVMWYSLLIGAAWSAVIVLSRRNLAERMGRLYRYVQRIAADGKMVPYRTGSGGNMKPAGQAVSGDRSGEFCFAVSILGGVLCNLFLGGQAARLL